MAKALDWGILEGSVGPRVRLLRNALSARSIAVSAPHGLPTGSLTVLALIAANPGSSQTALASRAGLNKSALVGIIDQLGRGFGGQVGAGQLGGEQRMERSDLHGPEIVDRVNCCKNNRRVGLPAHG